MTANKWIVVCIVGLMTSLGVMIAVKRRLQGSSNQVEQASVSENLGPHPKPAPYKGEVPTINLRAGEDFVRVFSRMEMYQLGFKTPDGSPGLGGIMTKSRYPGQNQRYTIWGPGPSPNEWPWQPLKYFEEH